MHRPSLIDFGSGLLDCLKRMGWREKGEHPWTKEVPVYDLCVTTDHGTDPKLTINAVQSVFQALVVEHRMIIIQGNLANGSCTLSVNEAIAERALWAVSCTITETQIRITIADHSPRNPAIG